MSERAGGPEHILEQLFRLANEPGIAEVVRMHKHQVAPRSDGVASGRSAEVRYALVLEAELITVGKTSGANRALYFKIGFHG